MGEPNSPYFEFQDFDSEEDAIGYGCELMEDSYGRTHSNQGFLIDKVSKKEMKHYINTGEFIGKCAIALQQLKERI